MSGHSISMIKKTPAVILGLLRIVDMAMILVAAFLAYFIRHDWGTPPEPYFIAIVVGVLISAQVFQLGGIYSFGLLDQMVKQAARIAALLGIVAALLIVLAFFTKDASYFSRAWAALWLALAGIGMGAARIQLFFMLRQWRRDGELTRKAIIVGGGEQAARLLRHLRSSGGGGMQVMGIFDDRKTRIPAEIDGVQVLGTTRDLLDWVRKNQLDLIILALPWTAERRLIQLMNDLRVVPVDIQLAPDNIGFSLYDRGVTHLAGVPMLTVFEKPLAGWSYLLKAVEDRLLGAIILLAFSPLMLLIALGIKLSSPGPVLFRQKRQGFNNNVFEIYKFRSMHYHAAEAQTVPQATRQDPRITRIGAFLRRTSLDELPQLFNVLKGEMSIVGPRPHAITHNHEYARRIGQYYGRHRVKPGITGWAQIHGYRGEINTPEKMEKRVQYDLYYIDHWSILLDFKILVMTAFVGFVNKNAY
jgi:putative colanic acid biosynthesis UDP-glucose lipid carrier transferase